MPTPFSSSCQRPPLRSLAYPKHGSNRCRAFFILSPAQDGCSLSFFSLNFCRSRFCPFCCLHAGVRSKLPAWSRAGQRRIRTLGPHAACSRAVPLLLTRLPFPGCKRLLPISQKTIWAEIGAKTRYPASFYAKQPLVSPTFLFDSN